MKFNRRTADVAGCNSESRAAFVAGAWYQYNVDLKKVQKLRKFNKRLLADLDDALGRLHVLMKSIQEGK